MIWLRAFGRSPTKRYDVINWFIRQGRYTSYLEIGMRSGRCLQRVRSKKRVGVDPEPLRKVPGCEIYAQTSDEFFASKRAQACFDALSWSDLQSDRDACLGLVADVDKLEAEIRESVQWLR